MDNATTTTSIPAEDRESASSLGSRTVRQCLLVVFGLGLALQLWLWWRSVWIYVDQAALFEQALGWLERGELGGLGKSMSGGVRGPAALLRVLVGAPLLFWESSRASSLLIVLLHAGAGLLVVRTMARLVDTRFALAFLAIYWLAPWRLYLGSFVWEPSYLFLPAAAHLWACARLRPTLELIPIRRQAVAVSLLLGLTLSITPQLHPSGFVLFVLTLLLSMRRDIVPSWPALVVGFTVGSAPALPALGEIANRLLSSGPIGAGLTASQFEWLPISGVIKAFTYWLRLPSADIGRRLTETTFCGTAQTDFGLFGGGIPCAFLWLLIVAANVSILLTVIANVRYFRGTTARGRPNLDAAGEQANEPERQRAPGAEGTVWLRHYVWLSLLALLLTVFWTPMRVQGWYTIVIFHAACVPVATWLADILGAVRSQRLLLGLFGGFLALRLLVAVTLGIGHPMFVEPERPAILREMLPEELRFLAPGDEAQEEQPPRDSR